MRSHYEYRTPLSFAVREDHRHIAEFLIEHGALNVFLGNPLEPERGQEH